MTPGLLFTSWLCYLYLFSASRLTYIFFWLLGGVRRRGGQRVHLTPTLLLLLMLLAVDLHVSHLPVSLPPLVSGCNGVGWEFPKHACESNLILADFIFASICAAFLLLFLLVFFSK